MLYKLMRNIHLIKQKIKQFIFLYGMPNVNTNTVDKVQKQFECADNLNAYMTVRKCAHHYYALAIKQGKLNIAAAFLLIASESAYLINRHGYGQDKNFNIDAMFHSLAELAAMPAWPYEDKSPVWGGRYASLATSVGILCANYIWEYDKHMIVFMNLSRLVGKLDDYMLPPKTGVIAIQNDQTVRVMEQLALLSTYFGDDQNISLERAETLIGISKHKRDTRALIMGNCLRFHAARRLNDIIIHKDAYEEIASHIDCEREKFRSRIGRLYYAEKVEILLSDIIEEPNLHMMQRDPRDIFSLAELSKARLLLDNISIHNNNRYVQLNNDMDDLENNVMNFDCLSNEFEGKGIYREMALASKLPISSFPERILQDSSEITLIGRTPDATHIETTSKNIISMQHKINKIEKQYASIDVGYKFSAKPVMAEEVMGQLDDGELLIQYFMPSKRLEPAHNIYIVALTKNKAQTKTIKSLEPLGNRMIMAIGSSYPIDNGLFSDTVALYRDAIQLPESNKNKIYELSRKLYDWLITPIIEMGFDPIDFRRWIFVPHGVFHSLPFATLIAPDGRFLIQDVAVSTIPSASVWSHIVSRQSRAVSEMLIIDNPKHGDSNLSNLLEAAREAKYIKTIMSNLLQVHLPGELATEDNVRRSLSNKGIVHIIAHGEFDNSNPLDLHRIRLTPDGDNDGHFRADEISRLDLHVTRLLVLNICGGSLYRFGNGDEPYGLLSAAFSAGVENVLGVLWPANDDMGSEFMIEFYKHINNMSLAEAMQKTCCTFIEEGEHPVIWGGYSLMGPGRTIF